jgi:phosphate transport system substrate-binding protein
MLILNKSPVHTSNNENHMRIAMHYRFILIRASRDVKCLFMLICCALPAQSYASEHGNIAFGDPDYLVKMDAQWQNKPLTYNKSAGDADLVISLGQQTYPALHQMVEDFAASKKIKIAIQQGTCGVSAKKLARKEIDIGAFCCPPGNTDRLPGIEFHTIGISPIALITNPANDISDLTTTEARNIFSGKIISWSEVPVEDDIKLPGRNIEPVVRLHCKKRPGHWRLLLDNEDMFSPDIREVGVIPDMIKEVADNEAAIGFETVYMLEVYEDKGKVKILSIDGHDPADLRYLLSADYPIYRTYNLTMWTTAQTKKELAGELLAAITEFIERHGDRYGIIPSSKLRTAGWKFRRDELIGEPDGEEIFSEH